MEVPGIPAEKGCFPKAQYWRKHPFLTFVHVSIDIGSTGWSGKRCHVKQVQEYLKMLNNLSDLVGHKLLEDQKLLQRQKNISYFFFIALPVLIQQIQPDDNSAILEVAQKGGKSFQRQCSSFFTYTGEGK